MLTQIHCFECGISWKYRDLVDCEDYICPKCECDDTTEEWYECKCNNCNWEGEYNPMDECPECGECELEEID